MANVYLYQFQQTYESNTVTIFGSFKVGASGAVTAGSLNGLGIASVVKESGAGKYTITFSDSFNKVLDMKFDCFFTTATGIAKIDLLMDPATFQADVAADKAVVIQCYDYAGSAANAASGSEITIKAVFRNSIIGS